jgi:hypothetical protein
VTAGLLRLSIGLLASQPIVAQEPGKAQPSQAAPKPKGDLAAISAAVSQLVAQLRLHPPLPSKLAGRVAGLYMIEVDTGAVTLIADEVDPGVTHSGSPAWSSDGTRIIFDAGRPQQVEKAHIKMIELSAGELKMTDLGVGNCPTFSPEGDQITFFLNPGGAPGLDPGIWSMNLDGSHHRPLGFSGRPKWSPDGRRLMLVNFSIPAHVALLDANLENRSPLQIPNLKMYSTPSWASDGTIVAGVGASFGDTIALIDVTDPAHGKVKEILWKASFKGQGPEVQVFYPVYLASTGRCVFIGGEREGRAIYSFQRGQAGPPKRLEPAGSDRQMHDLALSPDGRFALFGSNRSGARQRGTALRGPDARAK